MSQLFAIADDGALTLVPAAAMLSDDIDFGATLVEICTSTEAFALNINSFVNPLDICAFD